MFCYDGGIALYAAWRDDSEIHFRGGRPAGNNGVPRRKAVRLLVCSHSGGIGSDCWDTRLDSFFGSLPTTALLLKGSKKTAKDFGHDSEKSPLSRSSTHARFLKSALDLQIRSCTRVYRHSVDASRQFDQCSSSCKASKMIPRSISLWYQKSILLFTVRDST